MNGNNDQNRQCSPGHKIGGITGQAQGVEASTREIKASALYGTVHVVKEVRDRLDNFKQKIGSPDRPIEGKKEAVHPEIDTSNLVQVVEYLRGDIEEICSDILFMINEMEEDLL